MGAGVTKKELENETKDKEGPLVIAAIDFGTANTGYAFSLSRNPSQIYTGKYKNKLEEDREPTTVLLKPDGSFHSFGYKAIRDYAELSTVMQSEYYFFRTFKMELHNTSSLSKKTMIRDTHKKEFRALDVFSYVIKYLKSLALSVMREDTDLNEDDINWMLSVPAIWSDSARQFMREAAILAGIKEKQVRLVLEPEAASMYCRARLMVATNSATIDKLPKGYKYVLADLGGGTADICAHEILSGGKLRELYRASGGDFGGNKIDQEFYKFMINLVGGPVWTLFRDEHSFLYQEFLQDFETKKKGFISDSQLITIKLENALLEIFRSENRETLEQSISQMTSRYRKGLKFRAVDQRLEIKGDIMADFFKSTVDSIIEKLFEVMEESNLNNTSDEKALLLVGGFSESPYLREKLQARFSGKVRILLEQDARFAVMKGAVLMGYNPKNIVERMAAYTYGFSSVRRFVKGKDPDALKTIRNDGKEYCDAHFEKIIEKGHILKEGDKKISSIFEIRKEDTTKTDVISVELWQSKQQDPKYCRVEEDCERIAEVIMQPPANGWPERTKIFRHLVIGETEFNVEIVNASTGKRYEAKIDFLLSSGDHV